MRTLKADLLVTPALRALSASSVIGGLPQASAPTTWCIHRPSCSVAVRSASCSLLSFAKLGNALVTRRPKEKPVPPDGFRYILKSPRRARQSWQPWPSSREREREREVGAAQTRVLRGYCKCLVRLAISFLLLRELPLPCTAPLGAEECTEMERLWCCKPLEKDTDDPRQCPGAPTFVFDCE